MKIKKKKNQALINLSNNEQVTFFLGTSQFDYCRKNFGAYVTPSILKRCKNFNLNAYLLLKEKTKEIQLALVKKNKIKIFKNDLKKNYFKIIVLMKLKNFKSR